MKPSRKIAIVTPDFVGPVRNGGVGTAMYWLSKTLAQEGYIVDVLFTGVIEAGDPEHWARFFRDEHGFDFVDLMGWMARHAPKEAGRRFYPDSENRRISHLALQFLRGQDYAAIYFQDYLGHGLRTLQFKRAGLGFADTRCIVTLHSCQRWIREGMEQMPSGVGDLELDFQECESARLADTIVAPSRHMARWAARRWGLDSTRIEVLPYCFEEPAARGARQRVTHAGFSHLVFFGRLETRKGLHFLLHALARSELLRRKVRRVTFLGKRATVDGRPSGEAIAAALRGLPYVHEIIDNKNAVEAWDWLRVQQEMLVVAPSTLDNLPFSIIELFCRRVPFVTTDIGGIPEIVGPANPEITAPATPAGVMACLERIVGAGEFAIDYRSGYQPVRANRSNAAFLRAQLAIHSAAVPARRLRRPGREPVVSVVVPHFNCSAYLSIALETLRNQKGSVPFEVIVVDDCSTLEVEKARFRALRRTFASGEIRFVESRRNRGPGGARNFGAARSRGRYLVFFDADNEAEPGMLAVMLRAIECSGCDCMSCFSSVIPQDDREAPRPLEAANEAIVYAPLGACLEAGFLYNLYGDTCSIWKKTVFDEIGGFSEDRVKFEDWELFTRLAVRGFRLGVIPEPLYRYRSQDGSYNTEALDFPSRALILENYNRPEASRRVDMASLCAVLAADPGGRSRPLDATAYDFFAGMRDEHLEQYLEIDRVSGSSSERGLRDIQAMRRRADALAARWMESNPRVMIYGSGLHTKVLLATNPILARWVVGFIDQKRRDRFLGRPCIVPGEFVDGMADVVLYSSRPNERQMHAALSRHKVEHVLIYGAPEPAKTSG